MRAMKNDKLGENPLAMSRDLGNNMHSFAAAAT
jgi:hypothetical protein